MYGDQVNSVPCWYVIHTHPKQEDRADYNLRAWNIETFSPKFRECRRNPFTGEPSYAIKPLFPGYIFARFEVGSLYHKIRYTRGIHSVVSFDTYPIPVDQEIIDLIQQRVSKDSFVKLAGELVPGDQVVIKEGPLKDFTGVFLQELKESQRVVILLNTVSYQARALVDKEILKKVL